MSNRNMVIQSWENIKTVLIDDFLFNGKPLLLLLPSTKEFNEQALNKSVLTDAVQDNLLQISAGKSGENEISQEIKSKSLSALKTRLKEAQLLLESTSSESKSKLNYIKETVVRIQNLAELGSVQPIECEPTLIKVTEGSLIEPDSPKEHMKSPIMIVQLYQTFVSENWILLMQIANQSKCVLGKTTLKLSADEFMNYYVKNFTVKNDTKQLFLLPGQSSVLVAVIPVNQQLFSLLDITIHVSVVYQILESENILLSHKQWSCLHYVSCGTIQIIKDGLKTCEHEHWNLDTNVTRKVDKCPKEYLMKLAHIAAVQSLTLIIKSISTDLSNLMQILQNLFHLKDDFNMLSWKDSSFALNMWMEVQKETSNEASLEVYYSHESQVLMFLQLLYKHFPPDFCVIPHRDSSSSAALIQHLQEELKFLSMPFKNSVCNEAEGVKSTPWEFKDGDDARREFASEQLKFENRLDGIKIKDYQSFKEKISSYELKCDEIVGLLQTHAISLD